MSNRKDLAISILVGGKSTRFGVLKGTIKLLNKPLILYQIETLAKFDEDVYLIARSDEQVFLYKKEVDFPEEINFIIDDEEFISDLNIFNPIFGIASAFKELIAFKKVFILACDVPLIKAEVIKLMIKESEGYDCCIPRWENGYLEPLFAIYPVKKALKRAKEIIKNKEYALGNLLEKTWNINYLSVEKEIRPLDNELTSLLNINGPIAMEKAIKLFKKGND